MGNVRSPSGEVLVDVVIYLTRANPSFSDAPVLGRGAKSKHEIATLSLRNCQQVRSHREQHTVVFGRRCYRER